MRVSIQMIAHSIVSDMLETEESAELFENGHHLARIQRANPDLKPDLVTAVLNADPTGGSYADWIITKLRAGTLSFPEDTEKVRNTLSRFNRLKQSQVFKGSRNIYDYETYGSLAKAVQHLETKNGQERINATTGAVPVKKLRDLELIELRTPEAAATVCKNTHWCIKNPKFFKSYTERGGRYNGLYVVLKDGYPYAAVHPFSQAVDVYDDSIDNAMAQEIAPLFKRIPLNPEALNSHATQQRDKQIDSMIASIERRFKREQIVDKRKTEKEAEEAWELDRAKFVKVVPALGHVFGFVSDGLVRLAMAVHSLSAKR